MIQCTFEDGNEAKLRHVVVDSIILKDGKVLLVQRAKHLIEGGKWGIPGGYVDRDETAEDATLRELREETGMEGKIQKLFCIITFPDRSPFDDRQNIVFCYTAEVTSDSESINEEVTEKKWFSELELKNLDMAFDHEKILRAFFKHKRDGGNLPLIINSGNDY